MKGALALLSGLGVGAALMYLFDPNEGNRRRALIRDKATKMNRQTREVMGGRMEDLSNRAKGLLHETKSAFGGTASEQDQADAGSMGGRESFSN